VVEIELAAAIAAFTAGGALRGALARLPLRTAVSPAVSKPVPSGATRQSMKRTWQPPSICSASSRTSWTYHWAWLWAKMPALRPPRDQISRASVAAESAMSAWRMRPSSSPSTAYCFHSLGSSPSGPSW
jgi:hypothetical protein